MLQAVGAQRARARYMQPYDKGTINARKMRSVGWWRRKQAVGSAPERRPARNVVAAAKCCRHACGGGGGKKARCSRLFFTHVV